MFRFRNTPCMLRKHLVQFGCFLSINLIAKCAKELTANISNFLLIEITDMNWETGIKGQIMDFWSPKHITSYGSWALLLPPSHSFPLTPLELQWEEGFPPGKHQWSFSFADRELLGRPDSCALKAWLGLACCTILWVIFDHSFIGVLLKESLQWQLSLRMNVHTADLKKTTLHWINVMLTT